MTQRNLARMSKVVLEFGEHMETVYVDAGVVRWTVNPELVYIQGLPLAFAVTRIREKHKHKVVLHSMSPEDNLVELFPEIKRIIHGGIR